MWKVAKDRRPNKGKNKPIKRANGIRKGSPLKDPEYFQRVMEDRLYNYLLCHLLLFLLAGSQPGLSPTATLLQDFGPSAPTSVIIFRYGYAVFGFYTGANVNQQLLYIDLPLPEINSSAISTISSASIVKADLTTISAYSGINSCTQVNTVAWATPSSIQGTSSWNTLVRFTPNSVIILPSNTYLWLMITFSQLNSLQISIPYYLKSGSVRTIYAECYPTVSPSFFSIAPPSPQMRVGVSVPPQNLPPAAYLDLSSMPVATPFSIMSGSDYGFYVHHESWVLYATALENIQYWGMAVWQIMSTSYSATDGCYYITMGCWTGSSALDCEAAMSGHVIIADSIPKARYPVASMQVNGGFDKMDYADLFTQMSTWQAIRYQDGYLLRSTRYPQNYLARRYLDYDSVKIHTEMRNLPTGGDLSAFKWYFVPPVWGNDDLSRPSANVLWPSPTNQQAVCGTLGIQYSDGTCQAPGAQTLMMAAAGNAAPWLTLSQNTWFQFVTFDPQVRNLPTAFNYAFLPWTNAISFQPMAPYASWSLSADVALGLGPGFSATTNLVCQVPFYYWETYWGDASSWLLTQVGGCNALGTYYPICYSICLNNFPFPCLTNMGLGAQVELHHPNAEEALAQTWAIVPIVAPTSAFQG